MAAENEGQDERKAVATDYKRDAVQNPLLVPFLTKDAIVKDNQADFCKRQSGNIDDGCGENDLDILTWVGYFSKNIP